MPNWFRVNRRSSFFFSIHYYLTLVKGAWHYEGTLISEKVLKSFLEVFAVIWKACHNIDARSIVWLWKELEDTNKVKMALYMQHTIINHRNIFEKLNGRSEFELEIKICEEPEVKYYLLTQEVHLKFVGCVTNQIPLQCWHVKLKKTNILHILRFYGLSFILSVI